MHMFDLQNMPKGSPHAMHVILILDKIYQAFIVKIKTFNDIHEKKNSRKQFVIKDNEGGEEEEDLGGGRKSKRIGHNDNMLDLGDWILIGT